MPKINRYLLSALLLIGVLIALNILLLNSHTVASDGEDGVCESETVEDTDGNLYRTVSIGEQCWMAENLKTTTYRDGTPIPKIEDHNDWWGDTEGSYALYDHTFPFRYTAKKITSDAEMLEIYGLLYNFYATAHPSGLCPEGWRVPSDNDWQELEITLGMDPSEAEESWYRGAGVGSKLAGGAEFWDEKGIEADSFGESGFNALPAGYRRSYGDYGNLSSNANFWTADERDGKNAVSREIYSENSGIYRINSINKNNGHSVRCVKE